MADNLLHRLPVMLDLLRSLFVEYLVFDEKDVLVVLAILLL